MCCCRLLAFSDTFSDSKREERNLNSLISAPPGDTILIKREDGTQLRCISTGKGPTVVLAHGIFNDLRCFNLVTEKLIKKGYRVILFDHRGHGASTLGTNGFDPRQMARAFDDRLTP